MHRVRRGRREVSALLARGLEAVLFAAVVLLTATPGGVGAQAPAPSAPASAAQERSAPVSDDPVLEETTRQVAAELRCPVCQGNSIQDSPSELAQEMKGVVRDQLASGKTPAEVKAYFVAKYGEWILLEPKASGFNLVVYVLPLVMVLAGGFVIWRAVRKWTAPVEPSAP
jgi:cytochrome c-type biogenesis protein CcmH